MKMRFRFCLTILYVIFAFFTVLGRIVAEAFTDLEGMTRYWLVECDGCTKSAHEYNYYVVHGDSLGQLPFTVLDSITARAFCSADSNVIMYTTIGASKTYLIALYLSPRRYRDTLLSMDAKDSMNWLVKIRSFDASIRDSLLVFQIPRMSSNWPLQVVRLNKAGGVDTVLTRRDVISYTLSYDFSQLLFCVRLSSVDNVNVESEVFVYNLSNDSLCTVNGIEDCTGSVARYERDGPIYFVKDSLGVSNLWVHSRKGKNIQLTNYAFPMSVWVFKRLPDRLRVLAFDKVKGFGSPGKTNDILLKELPN